MDRKNCGCLSNCIAIKSDGKIKLCSMDDGNSIAKNLGYFISDDLDSLYNNGDFIEQLENLEAPNSLNYCVQCEHLSFCSNCLLRGLTMAKKIGNKCKWYENISEDIKNTLEHK